MKIRADRETVEKLLDIYRGLDEDYNNADWLNFLTAIGVEAEIIDEADYYIYF
jgi:pyrroloquinoline quinone (PQQ) biosynthesis protein C